MLKNMLKHLNLRMIQCLGVADNCHCVEIVQQVLEHTRISSKSNLDMQEIVSTQRRKMFAHAHTKEAFKYVKVLTQKVTIHKAFT